MYVHVIHVVYLVTMPLYTDQLHVPVFFNLTTNNVHDGAFRLPTVDVQVRTQVFIIINTD